MGASDKHRHSEQNRLLRALPRQEYESLLPDLETIELAPQQVLYEPNEPIPHVYFPQKGVVSLFTVMADGAAVGTASVGNEGVVGLSVFIAGGANASRASRALVQLPDTAKRIDAGVFLTIVWQSPWLRALLRRYTQAFLDQVMQSVACNGLHSVEQRCARWLLMTHDRVDGHEFVLAHDLPAMTLGVRRAGVTVTARLLQQAEFIRYFQRAGFIRYRGGRITVLDRVGLEAASCECYRVCRAHYDRALGFPEPGECLSPPRASQGRPA